ncbi:MAG: thermonuclease family protein [Pseudonocardia sp.]|nr:thermonuclease family protein [Pseudonocardia sp.]
MLGLFAKVVAGAVLVGGAAVAVTTIASAEPTTTAIVTHLVDGDTLDVTIGGHPERIRLLNVDTPETKDPDEDVQCLGPEASARLGELVPVGTTVTLEYDDTGWIATAGPSRPCSRTTSS